MRGSPASYGLAQEDSSLRRALHFFGRHTDRATATSLRILVPPPNSAHYSRSRPRLPALMLRVNGCAGSPASYGFAQEGSSLMMLFQRSLRKRRARELARTRFRPVLEQLETREVPAVVPTFVEYGDWGVASRPALR